MATSELTPVGADTDAGRGLIAAPAGGARRTWSLIGQYTLLVALAVVVLAPMVLMVMQALSPTDRYISAQAPLRPVSVIWKDRTWFSGGPVSLVARTLLVALTLGWLQLAARTVTRRRPAAAWGPRTTWLLPAAAVATLALLVALAGWPSGPLGLVLGVAAVPAVAISVWAVAATLTPRLHTAIDTLGTPGLASTAAGTVGLALVTGPTFGSFHAADGKSQWWLLATMVVVALTQLPGYLVAAAHRPAWVSGIIAVATGFLVGGTAILLVGPDVWTRPWGAYSLGEAMGRSLTMTVLITALQVTTAIMAAYAFVFLDFPLKRVLFAVFMGTMLLPIEVTLVGNVQTIRALEWTNTMQALVIPFGASALGTFLIHQGFRGLPKDIRDATRIDGYGHIAFLTRFAVPLTRPVVASFTVLAALSAWNQYLWPRSVISQNSFNTLQIQLRSVRASEVALANQGIAAALVAAVPVAIVLVLFQRQIIRGLTAGAVK